MIRIFLAPLFLLTLAACQTTSSSGNSTSTSHANSSGKFLTEIQPLEMSGKLSGDFSLEKSLWNGNFTRYSDEILADLEKAKSGFEEPGTAIGYLAFDKQLNIDRNRGVFREESPDPSISRNFNAKQKAIVGKIRERLSNVTPEEISIASSCLAKDEWTLLPEDHRAILNKMALGEDVVPAELERLKERTRIKRQESMRIKCMLEPYGLYDELMASLR